MFKELVYENMGDQMEEAQHFQRLKVGRDKFGQHACVVVGDFSAYACIDAGVQIAEPPEEVPAGDTNKACW